MENLIAAIWSAMPSIASAAVIGLCGFAAHKLKDFKSEHESLVKHLEEAKDSQAELRELKEMQKVQNTALREILGNMLDAEHVRLVKQGYASPEEKVKFEHMYKPYHALNGNGTRTSHFDDVMEMHSYPSNK